MHPKCSHRTQLLLCHIHGRRGGPVMTEADTGEMRHSWSPQELGEAGSGLLPGTSGGAWPLRAWTPAPQSCLWTSGLYERTGCCCFEPPHLWSFVGPATGNQCASNVHHIDSRRSALALGILSGGCSVSAREELDFYMYTGSGLAWYGSLLCPPCRFWYWPCAAMKAQVT